MVAMAQVVVSEVNYFNIRFLLCTFWSMYKASAHTSSPFTRVIFRCFLWSWMILNFHFAVYTVTRSSRSVCTSQIFIYDTWSCSSIPNKIDNCAVQIGSLNFWLQSDMSISPLQLHLTPCVPLATSSPPFPYWRPASDSTELPYPRVLLALGSIELWNWGSGRSQQDNVSVKVFNHTQLFIKKQWFHKLCFFLNHTVVIAIIYSWLHSVLAESILVWRDIYFDLEYSCQIGAANIKLSSILFNIYPGIIVNTAALFNSETVQCDNCIQYSPNISLPPVGCSFDLPKYSRTAIPNLVCPKSKCQVSQESTEWFRTRPIELLFPNQTIDLLKGIHYMEQWGYSIVTEML